MRFGFGLSALQARYPGVDARYLRMPHVEKGMAVGLFGGSFNPPHAGHALVAEIAIRRLRLDQLWWMVTPGNPLKDRRELAPLSDRLAWSEAVAGDPRIKVTALEAAFNEGGVHLVSVPIDYSENQWVLVDELRQAFPGAAR